MSPKRLPNSPDALEVETSRFMSTIRGESDRGSVLVAAAFLDEALELLLRSQMQEEASIVKSSVQPLFTGIGPLKSFWAKTELARALGLIADYEYEDLTSVRTLRNHFAHSYIHASFDDEMAVGIVSKLFHFGLETVPPLPEDKVDAKFIRYRFSLAAAWLSGALHKKAGMAPNVVEPSKES